MTRITEIKNLLYIHIIGCMALLFACTDDNMELKPDETMERVGVTVLSMAEGMQVVPANETNEYKINTLRMYVFNDKGELSGYHYGDYSKQTTQEITFRINLLTGTHTFYTIVNEEAAGGLKLNNTGSDYILPGATDGAAPDLVALNKLINEADLKSLTFSKLPEAIADPKNDETNKDETSKKYTSPLLPMASIQQVAVTPNGSVKINLTRSVAKMKFYFAKSGAGICFLGRGIYLYNEPKYGYLFPSINYDGGYDRKEVDRGNRPTDYKTNPFYNDSQKHQLNGRVIVRCGWSDEPDVYKESDYQQELTQLDINEIKANRNDPTNKEQHIPERSFYLFANPNQIYDKEQVSSTKPANGIDGYYLKILAHEHLKESQEEIHKGECFYLTLPIVKANDQLSIHSVFTLDGDFSLKPYWMIQEWQSGGGDIVFN